MDRISFDSGMLDLTGAGDVEIETDGRVVWVNVDGRCRLRICQIRGEVRWEVRRGGSGLPSPQLPHTVPSQEAQDQEQSIEAELNAVATSDPKGDLLKAVDHFYDSGGFFGKATSTSTSTSNGQVIPGEWEMYDGQLRKVVNPDREGWWRFHDHYDSEGYCDNPARGY